MHYDTLVGSFLANRDGSTVQVSFNDAAQQMVSAGPIADALAAVPSPSAISELDTRVTSTEGQIAAAVLEIAGALAEIAALQETAFEASPVYEDTATGLAATAEGDQFRAVSADPDAAYDVYRHDTGAVATLVTSVPSVAGLTGKASAAALAAVDTIVTAMLGRTYADRPIPGWREIVTDGSRARRVLRGIDDDGVNILPRARIGSLSDHRQGDVARQTRAYPGWADVPVRDAGGRVLLGVRAYGTVAANRASAREACLSDDWIAWTAPDDAGRMQVWTEDRATGTVRRLTSGSHHCDIQIVSDDVIYTRDRTGLRYQPCAGGADHAVISSDIVCYGDSLTLYQDEALAYPTALAALTGLRVRNRGIRGQTSDRIAGRFDAAGVTITVTGGTIPGDGSAVACTLSLPILTTGSTTVARSLPVIVGGVSCVLQKDGSDAYTISLAAPGDALPVSAGSPMAVDLEDGDSDILVIWSGRNNWGSAATVRANIAAMVDRQRALSRRYVVLSVLNQSVASEYAGGADYAAIMDLNAGIAADHPGHYLDVRSLLVAAYNPASAQDVTDHGNDVPPTSLRLSGDPLHINGRGGALVARAVADFCTTKGWI